MVLLCKVPGSIQSPGLLYTKLTEYLMKMRQLPVFALLVSNEKELNTLFKDAELNNDMKVRPYHIEIHPPNSVVRLFRFTCKHTY